MSPKHLRRPRGGAPPVRTGEQAWRTVLCSGRFGAGSRSHRDRSRTPARRFRKANRLELAISVPGDCLDSRVPRRYGPARFRNPPRDQIDDGRHTRPYAPGTLVPGLYPHAAALLGRSGLRDPAALRHGNRRRHLSSGDDAARARAEAVEGRLCAAVAPAEGRPLRRKPQPAAALLPVPGDPQAVAAGPAGPVSEIARRDRHRFRPARHPLCRGRLGKPDARRLGARLGMLVRRHGSVAVHLLPAGRGRRMLAGLGRTHLRAGAARDVCAGRRPRLRSQLQRPRRRRQGDLWRRVPAGRAGIFAAQFRVFRRRHAVQAVLDGGGSLQEISRRGLEETAATAKNI